MADTGRGSLRQSVQDALNGDVIRFARKLSGQAIVLTNGEIPVRKHLTIDGSGLDQPIRISGNNASRVFEVEANRVVVLNSLVITEGSNRETGNAVAQWVSGSEKVSP